MITYPVRQGFLILSRRNVQSWSDEQRQAAREQEALMVFSNFSFIDEGRSRELIATCPSSEIAEEVTKFLNDGLVALKKLEEIKKIKGPSVNLSDIQHILDTPL